MTEKRSGLGLTFGPLGAINCPSCGYKAGWGAFKKEKDVPPSSANVGPKKPTNPAPQNPTEQKEKSLEDTKYDQSS